MFALFKISPWHGTCILCLKSLACRWKSGSISAAGKRESFSGSYSSYFCHHLAAWHWRGLFLLSCKCRPLCERTFAKHWNKQHSGCRLHSLICPLLRWEQLWSLPECHLLETCTLNSIKQMAPQLWELKIYSWWPKEALRLNEISTIFVIITADAYGWGDEKPLWTSLNFLRLRIQIGRRGWRRIWEPAFNLHFGVSLNNQPTLPPPTIPLWKHTSGQFAILLPTHKNSFSHAIHRTTS